MFSLWLAASLAAAAAPPTASDTYVVVLKDSVGATDVARTAGELVRRHGGFVEHVYRDGFKGFSARLPVLAASGIRRDRRVASVEALAGPPAAKELSPDETEATRRPPVSVGENLPFAPGPRPRFRRVLSPEADRYLVVLAESVAPGDADRVADELVAAHHGERGPGESDAFVVRMAESAARKLSLDPRVAYVEEQSIASAPRSPTARAAPRMPGDRLRRVAQPVREHYRFVLRPSVPEEQIEETIAELLRAYEGRRQSGPTDDPRTVRVEMSEPSARALSDDFRVERVEEQSQPAQAETR